VETVYGYFNNHYHGYAVENCLQIMEMLGTTNQRQLEAKEKIESYFKRSAEMENSTLEAFVKPKDMNFESLIRYFVPTARLGRAEQIKDSELEITRQTDTHVEATVRNYHIVIDVNEKTILHDCADWGKILSTRKLCKHIGKLLLAIDRERAMEILRRLHAEEETWQFKPYTGYK
jgi:hypothetical protein